MLSPEIMKYHPVNCTNLYSIPAECSLINDANYNMYFADYFPKIITPENYLGWLTIEEHVRLPRLEPALVQCCLEAGIRINAGDVLVFPATAVAAFAANCLEKENSPFISHTNRWVDYIGYRVQCMLRSAASQNRGILLDYD